ncbi:hypothetical protein LTR64_001776 [Lithohypha guttulata]|uniref:uncharacterized protein n=1 Tax=Lithohypha guttulata TaxID=1690604 RepID=UPI002DDFFBB0|nr:hypothetical protein LTR51_003970 [Lithohypha guttulata]
MSYWTEDPASEQDFMNITLGSLGSRDILALEDLDLLPVDIDLTEELKDAETAAKSNRNESATSKNSKQITQPAGDAVSRTSRSGISGGITWFEDMMQGSQLGYSATKRKGYGTSADGATTISWEVSEYHDGDENESGSKTGSKRKAGNIESDDTAMKG